MVAAVYNKCTRGDRSQMNIFEKQPQITISMGGKDYIKYLKYKKSQKKKLSKKKQQGVLILALCVLGMFLIAILMADLTYKEPPQGWISQWISSIPILITFNWSNLGKLMLLFAAPWLLIIVSISWLIHGVQLRILA